MDLATPTLLPFVQAEFRVEHMRDPKHEPPDLPPAPAAAYLLFKTLDRADPAQVFPHLSGLARAIHRRRAGRPIQVADELVQFWRRGEPCVAVAVYALGPEGDYDGVVGFACLPEQAGWRALQSALYAERGVAA